MFFLNKRKYIRAKNREENNMREIVKGKFADEIRKNYISISNAITRGSYDLHPTNKYFTEFFEKHHCNDEVLHDRICNIITDIYILCGDTNNYMNLYDIVFERSFVEMVSKQYFDGEVLRLIMTNYDNSANKIRKVKVALSNKVSEFERGESGGFIEIYQNLKGRDLDHIVLACAFNRYNYDVFNFNKRWIDVGQGKFGLSSNDSINEAAYFIMQFSYAFLFMTYIVLLRRHKFFIGNTDLMLVLDEVKKDAEGFYQVLPEFYLRYSSLYKNAYEEKFTLDELGIFIMKAENQKKFYVFRSCDYYKDIIEDFKKDHDFDKLIKNVDKNIFLEQHLNKDWYIQRNDGYLCNEIFDYLMVNIIDYLSDDKLLTIMFRKEIYVELMKKKLM